MINNNEFDDCEICKAMERAESRGHNLTQNELREAFRKQKESGIGIVGFGDDELFKEIIEKGHKGQII